MACTEVTIYAANGRIVKNYIHPESTEETISDLLEKLDIAPDATIVVYGGPKERWIGKNPRTDSVACKYLLDEKPNFVFTKV